MCKMIYNQGNHLTLCENEAQVLTEKEAPLASGGGWLYLPGEARPGAHVLTLRLPRGNAEMTVLVLPTSCETQMR